MTQMSGAHIQIMRNHLEQLLGRWVEDMCRGNVRAKQKYPEQNKTTGQGSVLAVREQCRLRYEFLLQLQSLQLVHICQVEDLLLSDTACKGSLYQI